MGGSPTDASVVVVAYNARPWLEQSLDSVRGVETVVVDHGSSDGTVELVRERFPAVEVVEEENLGLAHGWNTGVARTHGRWILLLNADAWLDDGALDELVRFGDARPRAAVVCPRLRYPDGRLQRSVRGFPSVWRIATEYLFLRKLAPRSTALNAFYAGPVTHDEVVRAEWIMGAVWLVRREAIEEIGPADVGFFLFSEETDWAWRLREARWEVWLDPAAGATHVLGAAHGGRMFAENVRSQLRWLRKHRGAASARAARAVIVLGLLLRRRFDVLRAL